MGNKTSNTSSQGIESQNLSSTRRSYRLSLNKSQFNASQKIEFKEECFSQTENFFENDNSTMAARNSNKNGKNSSDFGIETVSNMKNVSASSDNDLVTSDTITIETTSESELDVDTSVDDCFIDFTQCSVCDNEQSRLTTRYDENVDTIASKKRKIDCDSKETHEVSQTSTVSHISDYNYNYKVNYTSKMLTLKDSQIPKDIAADIQGKKKFQASKFVTNSKEKGTHTILTKGGNHSTNISTDKTQLGNCSSENNSNISSHKDTVNRTEPNKISHSDGLFHLFSSREKKGCSEGTIDLDDNVNNSFFKENNGCISSKTLSDKPDSYSLAKSVLKSSQSTRLSLERLIKSSVSSKSKKHNSIKEQAIVISDEDDETNNVQPLLICEKRASDPSNNSSVFKRSSLPLLHRQSTVEHRTKTRQSLGLQKVPNSFNSNGSLPPCGRNVFSVFDKSTNDCSSSQEIPFQGECVDQGLGKINVDNNSIPLLVASSSRASTISMPSLQRKSSSFYENEQFEELSPPQLTQHLMSCPSMGKEPNDINKSSKKLNVISIDLSSPASSDKMSRLLSNEKNMESDMYTEISSQNTEQSENIPDKIMDILDLLDTTNETIEDDIEPQDNSDNHESDQAPGLTKQQHSSDVFQVSVSVAGSIKEGLVDACIKKEPDDKKADFVYSEVNDEIYVLDSDDDEFFMSQTVLGNNSVNESQPGYSKLLTKENILKSDAYDRCIELNIQNRFNFKKGDKQIEEPVGQSSSKVNEDHRTIDEYSDPDDSDTEYLTSNEYFSDSDDLFKESVPLSTLVNEKGAFREHTSENRDSDRRIKDFPQKCDDGSDKIDVKNSTIDLTKGSNSKCTIDEDDDESYFLSQNDNVNDFYFAHTQVDYVACSDEELEQIKDNENRDIRMKLAENEVNRQDAMLVSSEVKNVECSPEHFSGFDKNTAPSSSNEECDTQDPFCVETQVYPLPSTEDYSCTFPAHVSLMEDKTQRQGALGVGELSLKTKNLHKQVTLARTSSPDLENLFNVAAVASHQTNIHDQCETKAHTSSSFLNRNNYGPTYSVSQKETDSIAKENENPFEMETETTYNSWVSSKNDAELRNVNDSQDAYNLKTIADTSSSDSSDCFFLMATQKSDISDAQYKNHLNKNRTKVCLTLNDNMLSSSTVTEAVKHCQLVLNNIDPFELVTPEASTKTDLERPYNMATQKINLQEIEKQNIKTLSSSSEDSDSFFSMATQRSFEPKTKYFGTRTVAILSPSVSMSEDTQDPNDTFDRSVSPSNGIVDNIATQAECVSRRWVHGERYQEKTAADMLSTFQESECPLNNENLNCTQTGPDNEDTLAIAEDTQEPIFIECDNCTEPNFSLDPLRHVDSIFNVQTQKDIVLDQSPGRKEMVVCVSKLDEESSESSSEDFLSLFYKNTQKDSSLIVTDQNPYDAQTIAMSSSFNEDTQDPFSVETLVDSPTGVTNYKKITPAVSSQQKYQQTVNTDMPPASHFVREDKRNQYQIATQVDFLDIKQNNEETKLTSSGSVYGSGEIEIISDFDAENEDTYFLPTQVADPQHISKTLNTSSPIQDSQVHPYLSVHTFFESALKENDPMNSELHSDSSSEQKQNHESALNTVTEDNYKAHQSSQNAVNLDTSKLATYLLKSIKKNRPSLDKCMTKYSKKKSLEMSPLKTKIKAKLNVIKQSPYFMETKDEPIREQDSSLREIHRSLFPAVEMKPFYKQPLVDPSPAEDSIKSQVNVFPSERSVVDSTTNSIKTLTKNIHKSQDNNCSLSSPSWCISNGNQVTDALNYSFLPNKNERHLFSDQETFLQTSRDSDTSPNYLHSWRDYSNNQLKLFGLQEKHVTQIPFERSHDSPSTEKWVSIKEHENSAQRNGISSSIDHEHRSNINKRDRKEDNSEVKTKTNIKKRKLAAEIQTSSSSSWISVDKAKNTAGKNSSELKTNYSNTSIKDTYSSGRKNIFKPKRKRLTVAEKTQSLFMNQVEKAKLAQQNRKKSSKVLSNPDQKNINSSTKKYEDLNEDVEMPSTQDMMNLGLPILSAELPVSKKHLALGLPSQGRVASEEKNVEDKHSKVLHKKVDNKNVSVTAKKNNNYKESLPPVPIFNPASDVSHSTSHDVDKDIPTYTDMNFEIATTAKLFTKSKVSVADQSDVRNSCNQISKNGHKTSVTFLSESETPVVNQSDVSNTCNQISDAEHVKQFMQPQTAIPSKSHTHPVSENLSSTLPVPTRVAPALPEPTQSEASVNSSAIIKTSAALNHEQNHINTKSLQQKGVDHRGNVLKMPAVTEHLQTLPISAGSNISPLLGPTTNNLETASSCFCTKGYSTSGNVGILKISNFHNIYNKTLPKVSFSNSHSSPTLKKPNYTLALAEVLKLTDSAKLEAKLKFYKIVLNWNPSWLKEREAHQSIPQLFVNENIENACSRLRLFYSKCEEYVNITINLLVLECWEQIYRDWKMCRPWDSLTLDVHCIQMPNHPTELHKIHSLVSIDVVGVVPQNYRRNIPAIGDFLIFDFYGARKVNGKFEDPLLCQQFGIVKSVVVENKSVRQLLETYKIFESSSLPRYGNLLVVKLGLLIRNKAARITPSRLHKLQIFASLRIIDRQIDALINVQDNPLYRPLLLPLDKEVFFHQKVQPSDHLCAKLNREQATAVATILEDVHNSNKQKVFLLQGPPGTGKSHTILALIHQILVKTNFRARICLATPSNAAVDEIAKRIIKFSQQLEKNGLPKISLVRVGNRNKVQPFIKKFMWDELVDQKLMKDAPESLLFELRSLERQAEELQNSLSNVSSLTEEQKVFKNRKLREVQAQVIKLRAVIDPRKGNSRKRYEAKCQVLDSAHIICGTLSSLGSWDLSEIVLRKQDHHHKRLPFAYLIIDEATQAIEVDCLIPLHFKMSKIVLVGDQEQLPATVLSQLASDKCLARSLFERIAEYLKENFRGLPSPIMMLTRQYRMHNEILSLPNALFYDNQLSTDKSVEARIEKIAPYLVFDIQSCRETRDQSNRSISNLDEALCTAQLCEIVKQKIPQIGVVCPYADQQNAIVRCLNERLLEFEVNTVDSFQGQERDVIILSCVRAQSSPSGIGFVADRKRMNVALTRAKQALYVIGHFNTLCTDDMWKQLYDNACKRKVLVTVSTVTDFARCAESAILQRAMSNVLASL